MIRSRLIPLIESNPLLLRDLRAIRRQGWRTRFFSLIVLLFLMQVLAMWILRTQPPPTQPTSNPPWSISGGPLGEDNFVLLCSYFLGIHAILHGLIAFWAFARARAVCSQMDELIVTPMPPSAIFWWIWRRSLILGVSILLAIYFPLYIAFDFLYAFDAREVLSEKARVYSPLYHNATALVSDAIIILFFVLPWISSRTIRGIVCFLAALAFAWTVFTFNIPVAWSGLQHNLLQIKDIVAEEYFADDYAIVPGPNLTRWHPMLTLTYMLVSAAYYCGLGVVAGLRRSPNAATGIRLILLLGPLMEFAFYQVIALREAPDSYTPFLLLYYMLTLYASTAGTLWLAFKWNLLIAMSRREILSYD